MSLACEKYSASMAPISKPEPIFFTSAEQLRGWFARNHAMTKELWIGFYTKASGREGISYRQALDEALCVGWIDGVRKRFSDDSYVQRFTPRTARSYWSAVNTRRAQELIKAKRMAAPGLRAFEARDAAADARYSFEREAASFARAQLKRFQASRQAWKFFEAQPPGYRKLMAFYVTSAKKEETRTARLERLIAASAAGRRLL
jgi:uncharacterized protein YdeI (YjbR/CyaY-like superfamily)